MLALNTLPPHLIHTQSTEPRNRHTKHHPSTMQNPRGPLKFIFLPASAARGSINGIALHPSEPNLGWGWTWGDLGTIQPQSNAGSDPAGGDTERKSHQHPVPWAKRSDGRRLFGSKMTVWKEEGLQWPPKKRGGSFPWKARRTHQASPGLGPPFWLGVGDAASGSPGWKRCSCRAGLPLAAAGH